MPFIDGMKLADAIRLSLRHAAFALFLLQMRRHFAFSRPLHCHLAAAVDLLLPFQPMYLRLRRSQHS